MENILREPGFLYFAVANDNDDYYLKGCRKFTFIEWVYYDLYRKGFRNVYYMNDYDEESICISCLNKKSKNLIEEQSKSLFKRELDMSAVKGFFGQSYVEEDSDSEYIYRENLKIRMNTEGALRALIRVYNKSDQKHKTAVFISADVISHIYEMPAFANEFSKGISELKHRDCNALIVIFAPDGNRIREWIAPKEDYDTSKGIFSVPFFPKKLSSISREGCRCFIFPIESAYNITKKHFLFWNTLEKDDIYNFLEYYFLKNFGECCSEAIENIDWLTLFVWAWYNVDCFSNVCGFELKANPYRKYSVIEESLDNYTICQMLEYINKLREKNENITCNDFFRILKKMEISDDIGNKLYYSEYPHFVEMIYEIRQTVFEVSKEEEKNIMQSDMWNYFRKIDSYISRIYCTNFSFESLFDIEKLINSIFVMFNHFTGEDKERISYIIDDGKIFKIMDMLLSDYYKQIGMVKEDDMMDKVYISLSKTKQELYSAMINLVSHIYENRFEQDSSSVKEYLHNAEGNILAIRKYMNEKRNSSANYQKLCDSANSVIAKINIRIEDNGSDCF